MEYARRMTGVQIDPDRAQAMRTSAERLRRRFEGVFSVETIQRFLEESTEQLSRGRVNQFVPVLAERFARERLESYAKAEGILDVDVPEVLFVCVHNAGRSQIAAALLKRIGGDRIVVRSAGSAPGEEINPAVRESLREVGVDLSDAYPKPLTDDFVRAADVVITMGCGDACPIFPGKRYEDWELDDPSGQDLDAVRAIRDEIDARVRSLAHELLAE
jgi:arsenate reductase (thioredoxin)